ncbi:MAG: beta-hydroxyacyl-ACP dehydratase [Selenomonas ruminantium]|nr:beta-hydroxyacyl-ACP dehydratase [Selenomonas ruminantium]
MHLSSDEVKQYHTMRGPFLLIDEIEYVEPGVEAVGKKKLPEDEWFFINHFPGNPVMPGVLQLEAMNQTGAIIIKTLPEYRDRTIYFVSVKNLKSITAVRPGKDLMLKVKLESLKHGIAKFHGEAYVGEQIVSRADFVMGVSGEFLSPIVG